MSSKQSIDLIISDLEGEVWKEVVGYEGFYKVSNKGRVMSVRRWQVDSIGRNFVKNSVLLAPATSSDGYMKCCIAKNGKGRTFLVHRLVAEAFLSKGDGAVEVNHINGNKEDNSVENLEWVTRCQNIQHAFDTGLNKPIIGSDRYNARLTEDDIHEIFRLRYIERMLHREIAERYDIGRGVITVILRCVGWKHVSVPLKEYYDKNYPLTKIGRRKSTKQTQ